MDVPEFPVSAKPRLGPGAAVGVDEAMIRSLVHAFYARVRQDSVLGPVFESRIDDWDQHLAKLCDFWSSVLLTTGRYKGQPMAAHAKVDEIEPRHFKHWLQLFEATARELWPAAAADIVAARSRLIGQSLELGLAVSRGEPPSAPPRPR
jgi:hemoglobin